MKDRLLIVSFLLAFAAIAELSSEASIEFLLSEDVSSYILRDINREPISYKKVKAAPPITEMETARAFSYSHDKKSDQRDEALGPKTDIDDEDKDAIQAALKDNPILDFTGDKDEEIIFGDDNQAENERGEETPQKAATEVDHHWEIQYYFLDAEAMTPRHLNVQLVLMLNQDTCQLNSIQKDLDFLRLHRFSFTDEGFDNLAQSIFNISCQKHAGDEEKRPLFVINTLINTVNLRNNIHRSLVGHGRDNRTEREKAIQFIKSTIASVSNSQDFSELRGYVQQTTQFDFDEFLENSSQRILNFAPVSGSLKDSSVSNKDVLNGPDYFLGTKIENLEGKHTITTNKEIFMERHLLLEAFFQLSEKSCSVGCQFDGPSTKLIKFKRGEDEHENSNVWSWMFLGRGVLL